MKRKSRELNKIHKICLCKSKINSIFCMLRLGLRANSVIVSVTLNNNYFNGCNFTCCCVRRQQYRHLISLNIVRKVVDVTLENRHIFVLHSFPLHPSTSSVIAEGYCCVNLIESMKGTL